jgi:hypothetical protein
MAEMSPEQKAKVRAAFEDALHPGKVSRRHPAEVTSDRLAEALDKWPDAFTGAEHDAIAQIRHRLEQIAEGEG